MKHHSDLAFGRWTNLFACLAVLAILASGCQAPANLVPEPVAVDVEPGPAVQPVSLEDDQKLQVVATTNIVGDVVGRVGGDAITLKALMGVGVDPHTYQPTPADMAAVHDAHVLFTNGAGLEEFLAKMLASAGGGALQVELAEGLALREDEDEHEDEGEHEDEAEEGHEHEGDPHVWFDVRNVSHWVATVEATLSALDPARADTYRANARAYTAELEELDTWITGQVQVVPSDRRKLVTNHPAFGYFADRYGFQQVGAIYPVSPSAEPSAQDLARLQEAIREFGVPAVFAESTVNPKLAQQVAQDTGIKLVPLYTGSLGGPGSGAATYIELMRYNTQAIVEALR